MMTETVAPPLLSVRGLVKHYPVKQGIFSKVRREPKTSIRAVDGIDFEIERGKTLALVGESGCGKTTTGRCVLYLQQPTAGEIWSNGEQIDPLDQSAMRKRRKEMQIIFQDPNSSLNPRMTIGQTLEEAIAFHQIAVRGQRTAVVDELLATVGLNAGHRARYPNELSGGQRQRIGIARALAVNPQLIVADEPVSALDVSVQAQILELLRGLREDRGLSYLFISHDLGVVRHISDNVAVMYLGVIVEQAPTVRLYARPLHPYSQALLSAAPVPKHGPSANESSSLAIRPVLSIRHQAVASEHAARTPRNGAQRRSHNSAKSNPIMLSPATTRNQLIEFPGTRRRKKLIQITTICSRLW